MVAGQRQNAEENLATRSRVASNDTSAVEQLMQLVFYTGDQVQGATAPHFSDKRGVAPLPTFLQTGTLLAVFARNGTL